MGEKKVTNWLIAITVISCVTFVLALIGVLGATGSMAQLQKQSRGVCLKFGNNGSVSCATFCQDRYWGGKDALPRNWRGATSDQLRPTYVDGACLCTESPDHPFVDCNTGGSGSSACGSKAFN